jgi:hypothetical protein
LSATIAATTAAITLGSAARAQQLVERPDWNPHLEVTRDLYGVGQWDVGEVKFRRLACLDSRDLANLWRLSQDIPREGRPKTRYADQLAILVNYREPGRADRHVHPR